MIDSEIKRKMHFAFNIWGFDSARTVIDCAADCGQDIILQTSPDVFKNLPGKLFSAFVHDYGRFKGIKAWLNMDHCRDIRLAEAAADNGWDMVMLDMSGRQLSENIFFTNEFTAYAEKAGCLVEAEVGRVGGIEAGWAVGRGAVASRAEIKEFLDKTGVDFIAAAFGNAHGMYKSPPLLDYDLAAYTVNSFDVPFAVHGGSGMPDEALRKLIGLGVKKINISTDLKLAYRNGAVQAAGQGKFSRGGFQAADVEKILRDNIYKAVKDKLDLTAVCGR